MTIGRYSADDDYWETYAKKNNLESLFKPLFEKKLTEAEEEARQKTKGKRRGTGKNYKLWILNFELSERSGYPAAREELGTRNW